MAQVSFRTQWRGSVSERNEKSSVDSEQVALPVYPKAAEQVQEKARQPNCSASELARVLTMDPALSGRVLKSAIEPSRACARAA